MSHKILSATTTSKTVLAQPTPEGVVEHRVMRIVVLADGQEMAYDAHVEVRADGTQWSRQISEMEPNK